MKRSIVSRAKSQNVALTNLPQPLTSFIGREQEINEITQLLITTRLLTLTGASGCGKTRLALQVATEMKDAFADGARWVELAPLTDPALVLQSIAQALGIQEVPRQPLLETLSNYLKLKHLLLILDNCEHLRIAIAQLVQTLLLAAPDLKILTTSREALSLAGETTYLVPSLSVPMLSEPSRKKLDTQVELRHYDASTLFIERAQAVLSSFSVTKQNAAAIMSVCQRLDGIPLAIELAAVRTRVLTVEQIAKRLDDRFALLTADNPTTVIPRHQTLLAAIDWSYNLLSVQERTLFRRLSVFVGGFTIEAAETICSDEELSPHQIFDVITELVDKSVLVADMAERAETRYRLLETMREYAREKLAETSETDQMGERHLDYFVQFAEGAEPKLRSAEQVTWLNRLEAEHDNIRAALQWSLANNQSEAALRLAGTAFWFWYYRGHWSEGSKWLEDALALNPHQPGERIGTRNQELTRAEMTYRAKALYGAGMLQLTGLAQTDRMRTRLEESLRLWRTLEDKWWIAVALKDTGQLDVYEGNVPSARARLEEGVALARQVEDKWALAGCLSKLGFIVANGDLAAAHPIAEEAVAVSRTVGDKSVLAYALANLAGVLYFQGDFDAATPLAEESLAAAYEIDSKLDIMFGLYAAGLGHLAQGNPIRSTTYFMDLLHLAQEMGSALMYAMTLLSFGAMAVTQSEPRRAIRLFGVVESVFHAGGIRITDWAGPTGTIYKVFMQKAQAQLDESTFASVLQAGRTMTMEQAIEEIHSLAAQVQGETDNAVPTVQVTPRADLTILAFGRSQVYRGEQLLASSDWTYAKSKELLFYLLSYRSRTKEQIGLDLWPDVSATQLRNTLGVRLHHLRRALGRADWIVFENDAYTFNRSLNYWFDVEAFETMLNDARRLQSHSPTEAIPQFQDAIKLYRGDLMEDRIEGEWFLSRRTELHEKYLGALLTLGQLWFAQDDYAKAAGTYKIAIGHDKYVEAAHRELIRCYARLGEQGQALRHYRDLVQLMRDELGSPPAPETTTLFERLQRGEAV